MLHRRAQRSPVSVILIGLAVSLASCGTDDGTATSSVTEPAATATITPATTAPAPTAPTTTGATAPPAVTTSTTVLDPAETVLVNVYWGWSVLNPAAGSPERLGAGGRTVAGDTPIRHALEALLAGPNAAEQAIGMTSSVPDGTTLLGVTVDGNTATVDLSDEFTVPGGSLDETMRLAQVVFGVTQFDGVDRVAFLIDGVRQASMLSHGVVSVDGFARDDFADVRPSILIEQPTPGLAVTDPLVIRGESNTFEATVRYAITSGGGDGSLVEEGVATATNGNGTWGEFEIVVDLADASLGGEASEGSIIMWEDSPRDGSQLGVVEIPVILPGR